MIAEINMKQNLKSQDSLIVKPLHLQKIDKYDKQNFIHILIYTLKLWDMSKNTHLLLC